MSVLSGSFPSSSFREDKVFHIYGTSPCIITGRNLHKIHHCNPLRPTSDFLIFPCGKQTLPSFPFLATRSSLFFFTLNSPQISHPLFTTLDKPGFSLNLLTSFKHFPPVFPQFFTYHFSLSTIPQISKLLFRNPLCWIFPFVMQVFLQIPQIHSPYYYYYSFLIFYSYSILSFLKQEKPSL